MPIRTDRDIRWRYRSLLAAVAVAALWIGDLRSQPAADLLLVGGFVYDGSGQPPGRQDVGVVGERRLLLHLQRSGDQSCTGDALCMKGS